MRVLLVAALLLLSGCDVNSVSVSWKANLLILENVAKVCGDTAADTQFNISKHYIHPDTVEYLVSGECNGLKWSFEVVETTATEKPVKTKTV